MNTKQQRSLQSFRRVLGWLAAHTELLRAAPAAVAALLAQLGEIVARIESNATLQGTQHRLSTRSATDAKLRRAAVVNAMRPIAQVARTLRGSVLGISSISTMPGNADNERLVTAANSMAENASVFSTTLIEHGLQPDCIETLRTAAAALKSSVDARGLAKARGVGATNGIPSDITQALKLVSRLDASLMAQLRNDPSMLASWRNAKRVTTKGVIGTIETLTVAAPSTTPPATTAAPAVHTA